VKNCFFENFLPVVRIISISLWSITCFSKLQSMVGNHSIHTRIVTPNRVAAILLLLTYAIFDRRKMIITILGFVWIAQVAFTLWSISYIKRFQIKIPGFIGCRLQTLGSMQANWRFQVTMYPDQVQSFVNSTKPLLPWQAFSNLIPRKFCTGNIPVSLHLHRFWFFDLESV
jgi:hypothetical protein